VTASRPTPAWLVEARELAFAWPDSGFRLRIPEFLLPPGGRAALVGPSGSGKSTLIHLLGGILRPAGGILRVDGRELPALSEAELRAWRSRRVGLVFQDLELLEFLDLRDNLLLPWRIGAGLRLDDTARRRAGELARALGLEGLLARRPSRLSRGERQRAALARALGPGPALLLCDEPTASLDPPAARRALDLLLEQAAAQGAGVVVATHDPGVLDRFETVLDLGTLGGEEAGS